MYRLKILFIINILVFTACSQRLPVEEVDLSSPTVALTAVPEQSSISSASPVPTETAVPSAPIATAEQTPSSTSEQALPTADPSKSTQPMTANLSPAEAVAVELAALVPPERDDLRLAVAYRGVQDTTITHPPIRTEPLSVGAQETFTILNVVDNTVSEIEAELFAVSDKAYFWFDLGPVSVTPEPEDLAHVTQIFDEIYVNVVNQFGSERNPGIDGDPRLHIVHASPEALCGVTEESVDQCSLAGLVNSTDLLPEKIDPRSNEREMFVMNARRFGTDYYLGVLAHEFRHMIEDNYDNSDADWEVEGSATLSAELAGLPSGGVRRGNLFLEQPDQQLNSWTDEGTSPYYGQGYLFNRFIYDQLGQDLYRQFATNPLPGLLALDDVTASAGLERDAHSMWLDYIAALAIHNDPQAPERFQFESSGLNTAAMTEITSLPDTYEEQVSQYAADFYQLPSGVSGIDFAGAADVSLLGIKPISGNRYWFAQRANYSNPRLTYRLDLSDLQMATLTYDIYTDIEQGYDFAYVSVSLDDGRTWTPLVSEQMQGLDPLDNPAGSALTDRFYTGRQRQWIADAIDLSTYAGQEILLRFEYVTDPILTYGGLALDNISIQELGFFDGAEEIVDSALAEGFVRATPRIPQSWHLQTITFGDDGPQVQYYPVHPSGDFFLTFERPTQESSILIIAATAPTTLERATYELTISD